MPIDLGLARISRLLSIIGNPHVRSYKSIHVAGTNGKGSTVAYLSSILTLANIRNGRFTSPHLLEPNDCISINNETYSLAKFEQVRKHVSFENDRLSLGCTEFELLTATAFKIFEIERVELALVEVGVGGRLDATNVLESRRDTTSNGGVIIAGITKIGMDHENLLGNTMEEIATEKAGIIKSNISVIVDGTNDEAVLKTVRDTAQRVGAEVLVADSTKIPSFDDFIAESPLHGEYQIQNLAVALMIVHCLKEKYHYNELTWQIVRTGVKLTSWPGRLQSITDVRTGISALIDGAHNESAARELGKFLHSYRAHAKSGGLIFVIAQSQGKSTGDLLKFICKKSDDTVLTAHFTQPIDMPWVNCYLEAELAKSALLYVNDVRQLNSSNMYEVFEELKKIKADGDSRPIIFCGSLYLCSDILRYLRDGAIGLQERVDK